LKAFRIQESTSTASLLSEQPREMNPHVEQEEAQGQEHKTIGRIGRGCPAQNLSGATVAGFDAEAPAIAPFSLLRGTSQIDQDEDQPSGLAFLASGSLGGGEDPTDGQVGGEGLAAAGVAKCVGREVAFVALTQCSGTRLLAANAAGDDSGQAKTGQVAQLIDARKGFIQKQAGDLQLAGLQASDQVLQDMQGVVSRQDKPDGQGDPQAIAYDVGRSHAVETMGAIAQLTLHPQPFRLGCLTIIRSVVEVDGHFLGLLEHSGWGLLRQGGIQALFQLWQVCYPQLLVQVGADGFRFGDSLQILANRFQGALAHSDPQKHIQQVIRRHFVALGVQGQVRFQSLASVMQHFLIRQFQVIIQHGLALSLWLLVGAYNHTRFEQAFIV